MKLKIIILAFTLLAKIGCKKNGSGVSIDDPEVTTPIEKNFYHFVYEDNKPLLAKVFFIFRFHF